MRKLHLTFLNEDQTKKTLVIHCVHQDLSPAAVKEAMEQIVELDLFEKDGVRLMTEVYSAKYVEVIETPLFDNDNEMVLPIPTQAVDAVTEEIEEVNDVDITSTLEEKNEEPIEAASSQKTAPQKQLAKIYPFISREELNARRAARRNQMKARAYQGSPNTSSHYNSMEYITPLIQSAINKGSLRSMENRSSRASP